MTLLEKPLAAIKIEISCVPNPKAIPTAPIVAVAAEIARQGFAFWEDESDCIMDYSVIAHIAFADKFSAESNFIGFRQGR